MNWLAWLASLGALVPHVLPAQSVSVVAGSIVYRTTGGAQHHVTTTGLDSMPSLSPDGRWIVLVRRTPHDTVNTALGWEERTELWVMEVDGSKPRRLLRGRDGTDPMTTLAHFDSPAFSLDGHTVYVGSRGWVTSDALHAVDVGTGRERFVCAANGFAVLTRGPYRGDLMVGQHRYTNDGSYDATFVASGFGAILGEVTRDGAPDEEARIAAVRGRQGSRFDHPSVARDVAGLSCSQ